MEILYRIVLPYACGGLIVRDNIIIDSAPIFKWMINKRLSEIKKWIIKKNGILEKL